MNRHWIIVSMLRGFAWSLGYLLARGLFPAVSGLLLMVAIGCWWGLRKLRRARYRPTHYEHQEL